MARRRHRRGGDRASEAANAAKCEALIIAANGGSIGMSMAAAAGGIDPSGSAADAPRNIVALGRQFGRAQRRIARFASSRVPCAGERYAGGRGKP